MQPQHQQHPAPREAYAFPSHPTDVRLPATSPQITHPRQQPPLTRHESYPYPFTSISPIAEGRPRPPPLRTAHSAYTPRGPSRQMDEMSTNVEEEREGGKRGILDIGEVEELTTKGRKRKRLAKACSACHKNKRRCDGFAPCSNCEFSSRPCLYLNAQGETIPPPRTRESFGMSTAASGSAHGGSHPMSKAGSGQSQGQGYGSSQGDQMHIEDGDGHQHLDRGGHRGSRGGVKHEVPERRKTVSEVVDNDPTLSTELVDTFFRTSAPFSAMFHPATFHHRLYLNQISPILLHAIYAFAARSCISPELLACYPPNHPPWLRGEGFAASAHAEAERIAADRESGSYPHPGSWEEIEEIQAFALLSIYFACLRQSSLAVFYHDLAIKTLRPTLPSTTVDSESISAIDTATLAESRIRTFWLISLHDLCAAANGRSRMVTDAEMAVLPLPGPEAWWVRYGGGKKPQEVEGIQKRRDGLVIGSGNWAGEEGQVGELGHVLRILSIFSDIMSVANGTGSSEVRPAPLQQHQEALKSWAQTLPSHLRFDEQNLSASIARLQSPLPHISLSGWAFGYMHAIAECGMFYLQAAVAQQPNASWTAQRQGQAVDNIAVVLDAMGERGREGPLMVFPIAVVSNWQDHVRSTNIAPTPQQLQLDEHLAIWWAEARQQWGVERDRPMERGYQPIPSSLPSYSNHPVADRNSVSTTYSSVDPHGHYHDPRRHSDYDHTYQQAHQRQQPSVSRTSRPDHQDRRESAAGQYRLQHILDSAPTVQMNPHSISSGGLGLYSNGAGAGPSSRHSMSSATPGNGRAPGSPRSNQFINPYVREHPSYGRNSNPLHASPPDLINSNTSSTSLLLPTPASSRPNLPPLPTYGARPRAASSVIPYSVTRESSPVLSGDQVTNSRSRQHVSRLSLGDKALPSGDKTMPSSSSGDGGYYLPPSAELRHLRQLDEIPRSVARSSMGMGMGISLNSGKGWGGDPFAPAQAEKEEERPSTETEGEEPLGIAALISAAESERVKEEKRRESDGSMDSKGKEGVVAMKKDQESIVETKDVEMSEENEEASMVPQAVAA